MSLQWILLTDILALAILHAWNKHSVLTTLSLIYISGFGLLIIVEFCTHAGVFFYHLEIQFLLIDCSRLIFNLGTTSVLL